MSALTRVAEWLGLGRRAAQLDPLDRALNARYLTAAGEMPSADSAGRKVAVGSSIRLLTNTSRTMPAHAYRGEGSETVQIGDPQLLQDPDGSGYGLEDWVSQMVWALAGRGNAMGHIVDRTSMGKPATVLPLHPDRVWPDVNRSNGVVTWLPVDGKSIPAHDMLHLRMFPVPGQVLGLSPIEQHAETIGVGIAAERYGGNFFMAGGQPVALLQSEAPLNDTQAANVKARFLAATTSREPVVMPANITYTQIQVKPGESQFLDAQGYTDAQCCRIFGPGIAEILGYDTGTSMTYQNVIDRDLQLLKYSLDPYLVMIEKALSRCLPQPQYVKFNRGSLMRMNQLDRYRAYEIASRIGLEVPNEQRGYEDKGPVPWGNKPYAAPKQQPADQQPAQTEGAAK